MIVRLTYRECQQLRIAADMMIGEFENMKEPPPKSLVSALEKLRTKKAKH